MGQCDVQILKVSCKQDQHYVDSFDGYPPHPFVKKLYDVIDLQIKKLQFVNMGISTVIPLLLTKIWNIIQYLSRTCEF